MGYVDKGSKPFEFASKSAHTHLINDPEVNSFLRKCDLPKSSDQIFFNDKLLFNIEDIDNNPIKNVIAIDGGATDVPVKRAFPSSTISFFQFGALSFKLEDLESLDKSPFISPEDIAKLKELERIKLVLPTKNLSISGLTLSKSVRKTIYDFFVKDRGDCGSYMNSLYWFLFSEYDNVKDSYQLASCPVCGESRIQLKRVKIDKEYVAECPHCSGKIFLTDVFRFHEVVDDNFGASGIIGYLTNLLEQMIIIHTIRIILNLQPNLFNSVLFIKDGPLAFFGQTANMHEPMRGLCNFLFKKHNLYLAGLEKSGAFVEHADAMKTNLKPGQYILLDNKHIYKYIIPGDPDTTDPYARTSYYGGKLIYKSRNEEMYVISLPTENSEIILNPKKEDYKNIDIILNNIDKLRCDMYENSLLPVALANKLVSLSNHPSSVLLEKFARQSIQH